jgi:hypothetical protein
MPPPSHKSITGRTHVIISEFNPPTSKQQSKILVSARIIKSGGGGEFFVFVLYVCSPLILQGLWGVYFSHIVQYNLSNRVMCPLFQSDTTNSEIHVLQGVQYPLLQLEGYKDTKTM